MIVTKLLHKGNFLCFKEREFPDSELVLYSRLKSLKCFQRLDNWKENKSSVGAEITCLLG